MAATGERTWSSSGKQPVKFEFEPIPSKDWTGKIVGSKVEVQKGTEPGSLPYVKFSLEVLESAMKEGGKNRFIFPMLWLSLKPGKDGNVSPERANNIVGMARAFGEDTPEFPVITMTNKEGVEEELLDPRAVAEWLKNHDGMTLRFHSKVETYKDKKQAVVDYYIATDSQATFA